MIDNLPRVSVASRNASGGNVREYDVVAGLVLRDVVFCPVCTAEGEVVGKDVFVVTWRVGGRDGKRPELMRKGCREVVGDLGG